MRIRTNNPLERLNLEIKRRTHVVQTFPDGESALVLVGPPILSPLVTADNRPDDSPPQRHLWSPLLTSSVLRAIGPLKHEYLSDMSTLALMKRVDLVKTSTNQRKRARVPQAPDGAGTGSLSIEVA
jgi:Transposase, Mutator family